MLQLSSFEDETQRNETKIELSNDALRRQWLAHALYQVDWPGLLGAIVPPSPFLSHEKIAKFNDQIFNLRKGPNPVWTVKSRRNYNEQCIFHSGV